VYSSLGSQLHQSSTTKCINITVTILDITHCPGFHLEYNVSGIELCPSLQVKHTRVGPIGRDKLHLRSSSIDSTKVSRFHLKMEIKSSPSNVVFKIKYLMKNYVQNCDSSLNASIPSSQTYRFLDY
jgi:hypothetical protein